jgi:hypothetical protein
MEANLSQKMLENFLCDSLVYADPEIIERLDISPSIKDFFMQTGFPYRFNWYSFFMNLTPVSQDPQLCEILEKTDGLYTFGTKLYSPWVVDEYKIESIGLSKKANLQEIAEKIQILDENNILRECFEEEVLRAGRICIDCHKEQRIVLIDPQDRSITFINSSIEQLALSLLAYAQCLSVQDFTERVSSIDPKAMENEWNLWRMMIYELEEQFRFINAEQED